MCPKHGLPHRLESRGAGEDLTTITKVFEKSSIVFEKDQKLTPFQGFIRHFSELVQKQMTNKQFIELVTAIVMKNLFTHFYFCYTESKPVRFRH